MSDCWANLNEMRALTWKICKIALKDKANLSHWFKTFYLFINYKAIHATGIYNSKSNKLTIDLRYNARSDAVFSTICLRFLRLSFVFHVITYSSSHREESFLRMRSRTTNRTVNSSPYLDICIRQSRSFKELAIPFRSQFYCFLCRNLTVRQWGGRRVYLAIFFEVGFVA
jgi:hypothetical protein